MIHTIDLPYLPPDFEAQLKHLRAGSQAGFTVPPESYFFLSFNGVPLFEPLETQYIWYPGKDRDMWGKEMTRVDCNFTTVIFNSSLRY